MENPDNDKFDAELVLVADDEIEKSEARLYYKKINLITPYKVLNHGLRMRKRERIDESEAILNMIFGDPDAKLKELNDEFGKEVVDVILNGRLRMSLLLNSGGGFVASINKRRDYMDFIKAKNGRTEAYLRFAYGGAAELFLASDERIINPNSNLICAPINSGTTDFVEESNYNLMNLLTLSADKNKRNGLESKISQIKKSNPDNPEYGFSEEELMALGMTQHRVGNLREMRDMFLARTGITLLDKDLSGDFELKLHKFFED
jgi:hypothetical protein